MNPQKKRQIIVVKNIKEQTGPKKSYFVSRKAQNSDDVDTMEQSFIGNSSPTKPMKEKDGNFMARSILGDPAVHGNYETQLAEQVNPSPPKHSRSGKGSPKNVSHKNIPTATVVVEKIDERTAYFTALKSKQDTAYKTRNTERQQSETIAEYLPMKDRLSLTKESKVLTRWQERQRSWRRIEAHIAKRCAGDMGPLMMSSTDEFRVRTEEYDVLQAAIPPEERFAADNWEMTLREGNSRIVTIGHIFSGLECEIKSHIKPPPIIRKPQQAVFNATGTENRTTVIEESPALAAKRKRLQNTLNTMRPHNVTMEQADGLLIKSQDLFQWAQVSSKSYFDDIDRRKAEEQKLLQYDLEDRLKAEEAEEVKDEVEPRAAPALEFKATQELYFSTLIGNTTVQTVTFTNTGPVAMFYNWSQDATKYSTRLLSFFSDSGDLSPGSSEMRRTLEARSAPSREYTMASQRPVFFCNKDKGKVLPGESIETIFSFSNKGGGGVVNQSWLLNTTPRATVMVQSDTSAESLILESPIRVNLRGHTSSEDSRGHQRKLVTNAIASGVVKSQAGDEISDCIRKIRNPIRQSTLQWRIKDVFEKSNNDYLFNTIIPLYGPAVPIFVTNDRIDVLTECSNRINDFLDQCSTVFFDLLVENRGDMPPALASINEDDEREAVSVRKEQYLERLIHVRKQLFPEESLEIYDEVTLEMLNVSWDMDINFMMKTMDMLEVMTEKICDLDIHSKAREVVLEKERQREARREARKKNADSDDEEDEEDEEDEDNEGEVIKPTHPLQSACNELRNTCRCLVNVLFIEPLPNSLMMAAATHALNSVIDQFSDFDVAARAEAKLPSDTAIIPLPSAFNSTDGEKAWETLLAVTDTKGKVAAKDSRGPVYQQSDSIFRDMYTNISEALVAATDNMFDVIDTDVGQEYEMNVLPSAVDFMSVGTVRDSDIANGGSNMAVINFDGDAFMTEGTSDVRSVFAEVAETRKVRSLLPVQKCAMNGTEGIILLYENKYSSGGASASLVKHSGLMANILSEMEEKRKEEYENLSMKKKKLVPPVEIVSYEVIPCNTMGELNHCMNVYLDYLGRRKATNLVFVFVLENLSMKGVVPLEPSLPEEVFGDDEAPLTVGWDEYLALKQKKWEAKRPHIVTLNVQTSFLKLSKMMVGAPKDPNATRKSSLNQTTPIECYADSGAAVRELLAKLDRNHVKAGNSSWVWIDASFSSLLLPTKADVPLACLPTFSLHSDSYDNKRHSRRFVDSIVREGLLWYGILQSIPYAATFEDSSLSSMHLARLFPNITTPNSMAVIGGKATLEKFRVFDELLNVVSKVYIGGELCMPFIALSSTVIFKQYGDMCAQFKDVCQNLLSKARLRGVKVILPMDLVQGDEVISEESIFSTYEQTESKESYDDGNDYEGETKIVVIEEPPVEEVVIDPKDKKGKAAEAVPEETPAEKVIKIITVDGFVYDIGPYACKQLAAEVVSANMVVTWGSVGVCEYSTFQGGQKALVAATALKPANSEDGDAGNDENSAVPSHTLAIGNATVEWYARLADPEGEFSGNMMRGGLLSYACRESLLFTAVIGRLSLPLLDTVCLRTPCDNEWSYQNKIVIEEEEDEEEEEEEEEDD